MPATVVAGELLLLLYSNDQSRTVTTAAGWDRLYTQVSSALRGSVYARTADGTEGGTTVNFNLSGNGDVSAQVLRIQGWHGNNVLTDIDFGTPVAGNATTVNPPLVTAGWGSADNLFIISAALHRAGTSMATPLTIAGYTILANTPAGGVFRDVTAYSWQANIAAASSDPPASSNLGSFYLSVTNTLVIKPGIETYHGDGATSAEASTAATGAKQAGGDGAATAEASTAATGTSARSGVAATSAEANTAATGYVPEVHSGSGATSADADTAATGSSTREGDAAVIAVASAAASGTAALTVPGYAVLSAAAPTMELSLSPRLMATSTASPQMELSDSAPGALISTSVSLAKVSDDHV